MIRIDVQRVERWAWYLFVATIAWQTRIIVWQADAQFIEWRSASLYASDVLMVVLFVFACIGARGWFVRRMDRIDWILGFFSAAAILSLAHADSLTVGLVHLVRLAQGILFYAYLRHWAWNRFNADGTAVAFVAGALLQATLGISQYLFQHDVGLRLLGEPLLRTDMRGVAVFFNLHFTKILRAYGTFPHPNVLAAYLMAALGAVMWLWVRHGDERSRHAWAWPVATAVLLWAFFLTFSRTVVAVWLVSACVVAVAVHVRGISRSWQNIAVIRRRVRSIAATVLVVSACFTVLLWPTVVARMSISTSDEAVQLRIKYNDYAVSTGYSFLGRVNWTGVGIGNFTTWLARYDASMPPFMYQPVHNIYLLVYSEVGLVGLVLWLAWLVLVCRAALRAHASQPAVRVGVLALLTAVLAIGLLDHFYWTLQQGRMLWWSVMALAAGRVYTL